MPSAAEQVEDFRALFFGPIVGMSDFGNDPDDGR